MLLHLILMTILGTPAPASVIDCARTADRVQACRLLVESPQALKAEVYVKAWFPDGADESTDVIVFLHGRGYTRDPSQASSMLEDLDLKSYLASANYRAKPHIVLAPQDNFPQTDEPDKRGEDYWIGANGRDWQSFLGEELPQALNKEFGIKRDGWKIVGVSMGAHGAMKMAIDYPRTYQAFAAISPVFRSSLEEIPEGDRDVFTDGARGIVNNVGYTIASSKKLMRLPPHFMKIHRADFSLAGTETPLAKTVWKRLLKANTGNSVVQITQETEVGGHSSAYFKKVLPDALNWLNEI